MELIWARVNLSLLVKCDFFIDMKKLYDRLEVSYLPSYFLFVCPSALCVLKGFFSIVKLGYFECHTLVEFV